MANTNLANAKTAKNDEFYTQYADIQKEINQNFQLFGLKKLISTSYAPESKKYKMPYQPTLFETSQPHFNADKTKTNGKIFVLEQDITGDNRIDINDLEWQYLEGDGDFRSKEVTKLRDEADIIITNPPFSLFREFVAWLMDSGKQFVIIGNMNAIAYKEVFPLVKDNRIWLGNGFQNGNAYFRIDTIRNNYADGVFNETTGLVKFRNCCWYTNIDHGRRHQPLRLMTMAENFKHSKHKEIRGKLDYEHYINYDGIEVPFTDAIPSDYDGTMGVPLSFLSKYCPEQFEILGIGLELADMKIIKERIGKLNGGPRLYVERDGELVRLYERILIRKKQ